LLLSKLLITDFTEKDLKDVFLLLRAHELSEHDELDKVNVNYLARTLVNDWGFWYDVVTNLGRVRRHAANSPLLEDSDRSDLAEKTHIMLERMHGEPKTWRWRWRALLGTRKQWYTKVEE
jgi:hypothetical protein